MKKRKLIFKVRDFFLIILTDPERKSIPVILYEYGKYLITNQSLAEQYFLKFLYRTGAENLNNYRVTRKVVKKCWELNDTNYVSILMNKRLFEILYERSGLPLVKSLAHNQNSLFFSGNSFIQINTSVEFRDFIRTLVLLNPGIKGLFIKKYEGSCGGKNIYKLPLSEINSDQTDFNTIFNIVIRAGYIFQDILTQHEEMNKLSPYSINTVRFDTFTNAHGITAILSIFVRFGLAHAIVDNVSSGGAYVAVNKEEGTLSRVAYTDFTHGKGQTYKSHPLTKLVFEGFKLPYFKEASQLVIKAAGFIPQVKVIGWDIAIMPDGPVLLEGNIHNGLLFSEIGEKGFANNPVFVEMYNEANNLAK